MSHKPSASLNLKLESSKIVPAGMVFGLELYLIDVGLKDSSLNACRKNKELDHSLKKTSVIDKPRRLFHCFTAVLRG